MRCGCHWFDPRLFDHTQNSASRYRHCWRDHRGPGEFLDQVLVAPAQNLLREDMEMAEGPKKAQPLPL
jgi:hypothetical protein